MSNIKLSLDTRKIEQQLKKQMQEEKKRAERQLREQKQQAEKEAKIAVAKAFVEKQPIIGDFRLMDKLSENVLEILLNKQKEYGENEFQVSYDDFTKEYRNGLESILDKLVQYNMIFNYASFIGGEMQINLSPLANTYFSDKEKAVESEKAKQNSQNINIQAFNATGSNVNFGSISNSPINIKTIENNIEKQIEENGGGDKEELKEILEEVKELCENIKFSNQLQKRNTLMKKISSHLEKHGWFYGAIVQLIGTAVMQAMGFVA